MVHTVSAIFKFKSTETKTQFTDILKSPEGLAKTRVFPGCLSIECYEDKSDPLKVTIWQKWDSENDHSHYVKMRQDSGMFDKLAEMLEDGYDIMQNIVKLKNISV
jgi:quinol monooxygenase YgiN